MERNKEKITSILNALNQVIVGKEEVLELSLAAFLAGGHILLEDIPGVGKTTLAKSISSAIGCSFGRIQFTPDTLPGDVMGYSVFNPQKGCFEFNHGVIMNQVILADEINRTSPKTQSSLLEAMEEGQVTVDGKTYQLPEPFLVIATQNPSDFLGTYHLPEAQLDRFIMKLSLGYPKREQEQSMIDKFLHEKSWKTIEKCASAEDMKAIRNAVHEVTIHKDLIQYLLDIVEATRNHNYITLGISPRGTLAAIRASQAMAFVRGRNFVIPDDIVHILVPVFAHRLMLSTEAKIKKQTGEKVILAIKNQMKVPII
ncbi:AAA family ATPase [Anaeromicropila populeti]|uniref:MoxR-like ATPase n=1 Tax=Anaeromicropila populeti TaxID=37658 RepID=A0A1I6L4T7_9FIRM|nr:MoxR family ATPase [Anaeromicropila populeti]SFR98270.1 MoxR-like ATPase [Anaeromicropila populeti]